MGVTGLEPVTSSLSSGGHHVVTDDSKGLASTTSAACTSACTSISQNANAGNPEAASLGTAPHAADPDQADRSEELAEAQADPLAALAAALATLTPADRARLLAMVKATAESGVAQAR